MKDLIVLLVAFSLGIGGILLACAKIGGMFDEIGREQVEAPVPTPEN